MPLPIVLEHASKGCKKEYGMDSSFLSRRRLEDPWLDRTQIEIGLMCCDELLKDIKGQGKSMN